MKIQVENTYSDGHESVIEYDIPEYDYENPDEDEIAEYVQGYTGDGHGAECPKLGFYYRVEILESKDQELVGKVFEWDG